MSVHMSVHRGSCEGGNGPHLALYPGLTHAPAQHGEGVRFAHNGAPVAAVASLAGASIIAELDALAAAAGVPLVDYLDGVRYARAGGLI